jgi:hypothetical protein
MATEATYRGKLSVKPPAPEEVTAYRYWGDGSMTVILKGGDVKLLPSHVASKHGQAYRRAVHPSQGA